MKAFADMGLEPKTFERDAVCETHGAYRETGGSLTGRADRVLWFGCPECNRLEREREEAEAKAREEAARQQRIEARLNLAGIPRGFRDRTFDSYVTETDEQRRALEIARAYADDFWIKHAKDGGSLVFGGQPGTGKSHLALAIAQQVMRRGTAMYLDAMDLVRKVRSTWSREATMSEDAVLRQLGLEIDLLVIDEIGVQRGTEDEQMILFDVLNRRYRDMRPTILLTNLTGRAMAEFLGLRLMDRLKERAVFVPFMWESYRGRK